MSDYGTALRHARYMKARMSFWERYNREVGVFLWSIAGLLASSLLWMGLGLHR